MWVPQERGKAVFTYVCCAVVLCLFGGALLGLRALVGARPHTSRNKRTSFECGFDPKETARFPFSLRFFLLAVVFLIFDIEVALLFPRVLGLRMMAVGSTVIATLGFLVILTAGLWHEWAQGSLNWVL